MIKIPQFAKLKQHRKTIQTIDELKKVYRKVDKTIDIDKLLHDPIKTDRAPLLHHHYAVCKSTQDIAKNHIMTHGDPAIFTADYQFEGYGRNGPWLSDFGQNVMASIIIPKQKSSIPITLVASYVLRNLIQTKVKAPCRIKWPNDILIKQKKVAGILAESSACNTFWIVGVGLNLHHDNYLSSALPQPDTITYLNAWTAKDLYRTDLIHSFAKELVNLNYSLTSTNTKLLREWPKIDALFERQVTSKDQVNLKGLGKGINQYGHYLIQTIDQCIHPVLIGGINEIVANKA